MDILLSNNTLLKLQEMDYTFVFRCNPLSLCLTHHFYEDIIVDAINNVKGLIIVMLYLVTLPNMSIHGQFNVINMYSRSGLFLQTHNVLKDDRIKVYSIYFSTCSQKHWRYFYFSTFFIHYEFYSAFFFFFLIINISCSLSLLLLTIE